MEPASHTDCEGMRSGSDYAVIGEGYALLLSFPSTIWYVLKKGKGALQHEKQTGKTGIVHDFGGSKHFFPGGLRQGGGDNRAYPGSSGGAAAGGA